MNPQPSPLAGLVPILAVFAIFYFLVIRPQQKQSKSHEKMLQNLKRGDRILTGGGLYATIVNLRGQDLELKIADNVRVLASRSSVSKLLRETSEGPAAQDGQKAAAAQA